MCQAPQHRLQIFRDDECHLQCLLFPASLSCSVIFLKTPVCPRTVIIYLHWSLFNLKDGWPNVTYMPSQELPIISPLPRKRKRKRKNFGFHHPNPNPNNPYPLPPNIASPCSPLSAMRSIQRCFHTRSAQVLRLSLSVPCSLVSTQRALQSYRALPSLPPSLRLCPRLWVAFSSDGDA